MRKNILIIFLSTSFLFISCVSTKIVSVKDPSYRNISFGRILVIADYDRLETVKKIETILTKMLGENGVYAVANSVILPPIRDYTNEEKRNALEAENLDCYIIISEQGVNNATVYVPAVSTTETRVRTHRNRARETSITYTTPGGKEEVLMSIDTKAELYDFKTGNIVWRGEANTANSFPGQKLEAPDDDYIFDSFCFRIVEELRNNSLLK